MYTITAIEARTGTGRSTTVRPRCQFVGLPGSGERLGMHPGMAHQVLAARYGTDRIKTKGRGRA